MEDPRRLKLQLLLEKTSGLDEHHVKFQPPPNYRMSYPAIRYNLDGASKLNADNQTWFVSKRYLITLIHPDPDNDIVSKLLWGIPGIRLTRPYVSNNLNHYIFELYF